MLAEAIGQDLPVQSSRFRKLLGGLRGSFDMVVFTLMAGALAACSQIALIPRDQLAMNLAPILEIENRVSQISSSSQMLGLIGAISEEQADKLKTHSDVYYVYYLAANVDLAQGDIDSYRAHLELAQRELDEMEATLKASLADAEKSPPPFRYSSGINGKSSPEI